MHTDVFLAGAVAMVNRNFGALLIMTFHSETGPRCLNNNNNNNKKKKKKKKKKGHELVFAMKSRSICLIQHTLRCLASVYMNKTLGE